MNTSCLTLHSSERGQDAKMGSAPTSRRVSERWIYAAIGGSCSISRAARTWVGWKDVRPREGRGRYGEDLGRGQDLRGRRRKIGGRWPKMAGVQDGGREQRAARAPRRRARRKHGAAGAGERRSYVGRRSARGRSSYERTEKRTSAKAEEAGRVDMTSNARVHVTA